MKIVAPTSWQHRSIDIRQVANIQPAIINAFGSVELLPWVGTGFALGSMAILPFGKGLGIFQIRPVYLVNIVIFEACSVLCGAAPNMAALIVGRVISGLAGSGMYVGTLTYVSLTTSMRERPAYLAGSTAMWGLGTVLGPVVRTCDMFAVSCSRVLTETIGRRSLCG